MLTARDEYRAKCLKAMENAYNAACNDRRKTRIDCLAAAFDALHGVAFVEPLEATKEMIDAAYEAGGSSLAAQWRTMCAVGHLTNPLKGDAMGLNETEPLANLEKRIDELAAHLDAVQKTLDVICNSHAGGRIASLEESWNKQRAVNEALIPCLDVFVEGRDEFRLAIRDALTCPASKREAKE